MSKRRWVGLAAAGMGATAAAVTAGFFVERKVDSTRRGGAPGADELGGLHSEAITVRTEDGVTLHAEVDEVAPYSEEAAKTRSVNRLGKPRRRVQPDPTIVFVHGYALNLDCWHFQRAYFRGKHRLVFYDQRSHGRSGRSDKAHATIDQLGDDLRQVIDELVPEGPVVLVGHSMGGMSIMAFAERHRDLFDERVTGVALMSTSAGGLKPHHIVSRLIPDSIGGQVGSAGDRRPGPRAPARRLAAAPRLEHRLPGRRAVRVRRGRARLLRRVREQHAGRHVVPGARGVLPELRHPRQVRRPRGVRARPDLHRLGHRGRAHLGRAQPQDGQADPRLDSWSSASGPGTW